MRNTKQRDVIFEIVNNSYDHLTAYQVYEQARSVIPNISLGTVYRNLSNLTEEGKIRKIDVYGIDRYDKDDLHAHFVCIKCQSIIDVFDTLLTKDKYIDGNLVMDYDIKIKGICKKCVEGNDN